MMKMKETISNIKDFLAKWWLATSALIIAVMYYLIQRQGSTIAALRKDVERTKIGEQLKSINETEIKDAEAFQKSRDAYLALKRRYPEHFSQ
jgi:hypothetical protein